MEKENNKNNILAIVTWGNFLGAMMWIALFGIVLCTVDKFVAPNNYNLKLLIYIIIFIVSYIWYKYKYIT